MADPLVNLPAGEQSVLVKMINPVNFGPSVLQRFMTPQVPGLDTFDSVPSLSFLIEHPLHGRYVWDLGIRKDYNNYAKSIVDYLPTTKYTINVSHNVVDILSRNKVDPDSIQGVIWSHWHWDHIGNPASFPPTTDLIVGPGFKAAFLPGAPSNPDSPIQEADYKGRNLREIEFGEFQIGQFPAVDFFGDGSFYLLDSPGHAVGHLCGLARTTPSTFVLLGGDVCHFAGIFRPSKHLPVPSSVAPHPCGPDSAATSLCPGHAWEELQRSRSRAIDDSLFDMTYGLDIPLANKTKEKLQELDCNDNVLVIIAHDASARDHLPHFPQSLNDWQERGWGKRLRWDFLRELRAYWKSAGIA